MNGVVAQREGKNKAEKPAHFRSFKHKLGTFQGNMMSSFSPSACAQGCSYRRRRRAPLRSFLFRELCLTAAASELGTPSTQHASLFFFCLFANQAQNNFFTTSGEGGWGGNETTPKKMGGKKQKK